MTRKPFGNYCHKHGKGMFSRCQDCIDELVAIGIQADKDRIAELERENERLRKDSPQQSTWQPIAAAPDDKPLIVGWVDLTNTDRYYFDIKQDGVWQDHDDMCDMAEACAPAGSVLPNRNPPYEYFIEIPTLPEPPK